MRRKALSDPEKWIIMGIPALFILGTVMHYAYEFFWGHPVAGIFTAVNESVWEHTKMVLWPVILWWSLYGWLQKEVQEIDQNKWFAGALTALGISIVTIPLLYYFYTEAFGVEVLWVDILILLLAVCFGQLLGWHVYRYGNGISKKLVISIFIGVVVLFAWFTFFPPHIPLFQDDVTGTYGIRL